MFVLLRMRVLIYSRLFLCLIILFVAHCLVVVYVKPSYNYHLAKEYQKENVKKRDLFNNSVDLGSLTICSQAPYT